ncbi:argonaute-like protein [Mycena polygramma]|nr:argonaute-like protein [Mycena polygramma]
MAGTPVQVTTNSFVVKSLPTRTYYQYDVFTPADPKPQKRQRLIHAMQSTVYPTVFTPHAVYDGNKLLYSPANIVNRTYRVHGSNQNASHDAPGWYDIQIARTAGEPIVPTNLNKLMKKGQATPQTTTATNLLQLLLSQAKNQASPNTGRAYFMPEGKRPLRGMAVELWRGYYQVMRPTIGRMLVTIDTTVAAMYSAGPLIEVAMAVLEAHDIRRLALRDSNQEDFNKLRRHLKNRLIHVKTRDGPPRTKTVRDLVPGPVGGYEFHPSGSDSKTTVGEHYSKTYQITLSYPNTIGVVTSGKGAPFKAVIPLELCMMVPGQLYKERLPLSTSVVDFATVAPSERQRMILTGGRAQTRSPVQDFQNSKFMVDAGMQVGQTALSVRGRLLPVPPLLYKEWHKERRVSPRDGAWNVLGSQLYTPTRILNWAVVNFEPYRIGSELVDETINMIIECCSKLDVKPPKSVKTGNGHNVKRVIEDVCGELGGANKIDIIVFLLPAMADEIRTCIKFVCDTALGVRSQCLREPKLHDANNQLNARLGGVNALVDSKALINMASKPMMIFGADVSHPAPGSNRPSVASLVWSHDRYGAAYCATTRMQSPRAEIIADLKEMVKVAIIMFGDKHKTVPANVLFLRDGVSDGEFAIVKAEELKAVNEAFDEVWNERKVKAQRPRLTFVVVGKRHHVSFFPQYQSPANDRTGNCRAGLAVDADLANPQYPDFYLQSHAAIKGSKRAPVLQEIVFALCHVYAKATRSVSIPAPVYYADLACARGKFHVDPSFDMDIAGSTTSGGQSEFNLTPWTDAFQKTHPNVQGSMFFL